MRVQFQRKSGKSTASNKPQDEATDEAWEGHLVIEMRACGVAEGVAGGKTDKSGKTGEAGQAEAGQVVSGPGQAGQALKTGDGSEVGKVSGAGGGAGGDAGHSGSIVDRPRSVSQSDSQ